MGTWSQDWEEGPGGDPTPFYPPCGSVQDSGALRIVQTCCPDCVFSIGGDTLCHSTFSELRTFVWGRVRLGIPISHLPIQLQIHICVGTRPHVQILAHASWYRRGNSP